MRIEKLPAERARAKLRELRSRYRVSERLWGFHTEFFWKMVFNSIYGKLAQPDTSPLDHILCTIHYDKWISRLEAEVS